MTESVPTTKEQLIYYIGNNISLGTYDKKFLHNMVDFIRNKKSITTNQSTLFDKIVIRYTKQLAKKNLRATDLVKLPWKVEPIPSSPKFTEAHVSIDDDKIVIHTPYKQEYIKELKRSEYPFEWDKESRCWYSVLCEYSLKFTIELTEKHFVNVNYCTKISKIISDLIQYEEAKYWDPTLVVLNGRYYVIGINTNLYNAVETYLDDINISTLGIISTFGITVDPSAIIHMCNTIENFSEDSVNTLIDLVSTKQTNIDISQFDKLVDTLTYLDCDAIFLSGAVAYEKKKSVQDKIVSAFPNTYTKWISNRLALDVKSYRYPVVIYFGLGTMHDAKPCKIISITDQTPVTIK